MEVLNSTSIQRCSRVDHPPSQKLVAATFLAPSSCTFHENMMLGRSTTPLCYWGQLPSFEECFQVTVVCVFEIYNSYLYSTAICRKYNAPLPSSAAVERLFSIGGLISQPNRNRLKDENFEMMLFMRVNRAVSVKWWL